MDSENYSDVDYATHFKEDLLSSSKAEDTNVYFAAAKEYSAEVSMLKDELQKCSAERSKAEADNQIVANIPDDILENLSHFQSELKTKRNELNVLVDLYKRQRSQSPCQLRSMFSDNHVNPEDIILKTEVMVQNFKHDEVEYLETGDFKHLEAHISGARELFNMMLAQLNDLNENNREVKRTLKALIDLDACEIKLRAVKKAQKFTS